MRLHALELNEPVPELKEPHALVMLQPWIDVGNVGTLTLAWRERHFQAKELARPVLSAALVLFSLLVTIASCPEI